MLLGLLGGDYFLSVSSSVSTSCNARRDRKSSNWFIPGVSYTDVLQCVEDVHHPRRVDSFVVEDLHRVVSAGLSSSAFSSPWLKASVRTFIVFFWDPS